MPIVTVPKELYPLVPQFPGVPPLLRSGAQILDTLTFGQIGFGDVVDEIFGADTSKWGVFNENGEPVADYDSVFTFDYTNENRISDYPVEEGGFASYNKVATPFEVQIALTCGGSEQRRASTLANVKLAAESMDLFAVFTPTDSLVDSNIVGLSYGSRADQGATLLTMILHMREIRKTATATPADPKSFTASSPQSQGQIQTVDDPAIDASVFA